VLLPAQSLTITSPTADTVWEAGTVQSITWTIRAPDPSAGRIPVRLLYQVGPRGTWTEIGRTEAYRQSYEWDIPASAVGQVTVRAIWSLSIPLTVNSPTFRVSGIRSSVKKIPTTVSSVKRAPTPASDYRLESVSFQDGRSLDEGILYSPTTVNEMRLLVRIAWNKVPGRFGIQCENHKLTILDSRGRLILNPARVPAPGGDGLIDMPVMVRIPARLREDSSYSFRVRFHPAVPDCDADASNNERLCNTRLIQMGGNDLVVRVVEAGRHRPKGLLNDNYLRVTFEIMNPSGTDPLREVEVLVEVEGVSMARVRERFENLEPGVWVRRTVLMGPHRTQHLSGERLALVTVDPENRIAELREDNNRDGKRFRWN
jgi:hypothetical protein